MYRARSRSAGDKDSGAARASAGVMGTMRLPLGSTRLAEKLWLGGATKVPAEGSSFQRGFSLTTRWGFADRETSPPSGRMTMVRTISAGRP